MLFEIVDEWTRRCNSTAPGLTQYSSQGFEGARSSWTSHISCFGPFKRRILEEINFASIAFWNHQSRLAPKFELTRACCFLLQFILHAASTGCQRHRIKFYWIRRAVEGPGAKFGQVRWISETQRRCARIYRQYSFVEKLCILIHGVAG